VGELRVTKNRGRLAEAALGPASASGVHTSDSATNSEPVADLDTKSRSVSATEDPKFLDSFGRIHTDLRVSLTDRCSLRCDYCMPAEGLPWLPSNELVTSDEIIRLVRLAVGQGVTSVRLTGGEPLLRPDVVDIVAAIRDLPDSPEVSITTNGLRLPGLAAPLADAGVTRVNISLDTLDRETFRKLTRRDRLVDTLAGIAAARAAGMAPVKINAVLMRGVNDHEAPELLSWALSEGLELRFIEQMPLDPQHKWDRAEYISEEEILQLLTESGFELERQAADGSAPARKWSVRSVRGTTRIGCGSTDLGSVGIVASVSSPFCGSCDRIRLTADGQFLSCLFARAESDLRTPMRQGASDEQLIELMRAEINRKAAGHGLNSPGFEQPDRPMSAIGG
jgi:cyclic pyranopterin phosphate synthase